MWQVAIFMTSAKPWEPPRTQEGAGLVRCLVADDTVLLPELPAMKVPQWLKDMKWQQGRDVPLQSFLAGMTRSSAHPAWRHVFAQVAIQLGCLLDRTIAAPLDWMLDDQPRGLFQWMDLFSERLSI